MVDLRLSAFRPVGLGRNWGGFRPLGHAQKPLVHARGLFTGHGGLFVPGLAPIR